MAGGPFVYSMSAEGYFVPAGPVRVDQTIQRSRFITRVARAESAEQARGFVATVRAEDPDATHHCWAYVAGAPGTTAHIGMSDDGEPHGTAGRPMLKVLLHSNIGEIVAVCTRYYGGTKLGTGGLSRAYAGGVSAALERLEVIRKVDRVPMTVTVAYDAVERTRQILVETNTTVVDVHYEADVRFEVEVPQAERFALVRRLNDVTKGRGRVSDSP